MTIDKQLLIQLDLQITTKRQESYFGTHENHVKIQIEYTVFKHTTTNHFTTINCTIKINIF